MNKNSQKTENAANAANAKPPMLAGGAALVALQTYNRHLFVVAISPVQSFIVAARRMRDLAFGSRLLSELAADLAEQLRSDHGAQLIFPTAVTTAGGGVPDLARSTNKIVCLLPAKASPLKVAVALQAALQRLLDDMAQACLDQMGADAAGVDVSALRHQMRHALQLFHGWSKVGSDDGRAYADAYRQAHAMLDARKGVRNLPMPMAQPGRQLSSLDGARDSVLADGHLPFGPAALGLAPDRLNAVRRLRRRFQIDAAEQLDAIGLVKRVLGTEARFPALVRVALQPWVAQWALDARTAGSTAAAAGRLAGLAGVFEKLCNQDLARRNRRMSGPLATFSFDGDLLLKPRRDLALREAQPNGNPGAAQPLLDQLEALLADEPALLRDEAISVAVLAADGDHMGSEILDGSATSRPPGAAHLRLARQLAAFAEEAAALVEAHGGCALYAGGDDLLAVLPVQQALPCADALRALYAKTVAAGLDEPLRLRATLSIGIGIGHVSQPMGRLLQRARDACQAAKDGLDGCGLRNALGLAVQPRAGAQVMIVHPWQADPRDGGTAIVPWLLRWRDAFADGTVSGSLPYDLLQLADQEPRVALRAATARLFDRRGVTRDDLSGDIQAHWQRHVEQGNQPVAIAARHLADALYLCRWLAAHPRPAGQGMDAGLIDPQADPAD